MLRLVHGADAQLGHARDFGFGRQSAVLDAVTGVGVGMLSESGLDGVDDHLDRDGRLGMRCRLQPGSVGTLDEVGVLGWLVVELTGAAGVADIAVGEVRRPAAERAVCVQLDSRGCEHRIAERSREAEFEHVVEQVREEVHRDAHLLLARVGEPQVGLELALRHLGVADGCDTAGEELALHELHLPLVLCRLVTEVEVRPVVADLDSVQTGEHVACRVRQLTGEFAISIAEELAALGVRGVARHAVLVEREAVDDTAVTRGVHDVDLAVGCDLVELFLGGVTALREVALLVAVAAKRHTGRQLGRGFAQQLDDLGDRAGLRWRHIDPSQHLPIHKRMRVGVDETGHDRCIPQVDALGLEPRIRRCLLYFGKRTDGDDHAAMGQHCLGFTHLPTDGEDARGGDQGRVRVPSIERGQLLHACLLLLAIYGGSSGGVEARLVRSRHRCFVGVLR